MHPKQIHKLDDEIIKIISAGEVIQSPYSVVKELVENSIDSEASGIVVEIKNGGKTYIRVSDNGSGIEEKYVKEAFVKHSTSKISSFDDFINLSTNGFRGEALSSISAVAKITMTTKPKEQNFATNIVIDNDKIIEKSKVGATDGTTVIVEDIFKNIPARRKFLKSDRSESMKISDFLIRYALANPDVKFKYINNKKIVFQTYGTGKLKDVIQMLFSDSYKDKIVEIDEKITDDISIEGIIGNNSAMFSSRKMQYIFVNKRIIKDKNITGYIEDAYRKFIPSGNFPMFFVNIRINPSMVDVNIHPSKMQVKFSDEKFIYNQIRFKISNILDNLVMIPKISLTDKRDKKAMEEKKIIQILENLDLSKNQKEEIKEKAPLQQEIDIKKLKSEIKEEEQKKDFGVYFSPETVKTLKEDEVKSGSYNFDKPVIKIPKKLIEDDVEIKIDDEKIKFTDLTLLQYIGRIFYTYIILTDRDDMYMIDQHAAHERVLFEKYMRDFLSQSINIQQCLIPQQVKLPIELMESSNVIVEDIKNFGFDADLFGDNIILLRGIPDYFNENQAKKFIDEVLDIYLNEILSTEVILNKIATKACKAAIKGNDGTVSDMEVEKLIYDLEHCENKYACPHGRPTITRISKYEIEKFFKRVL